MEIKQIISQLERDLSLKQLEIAKQIRSLRHSGDQLPIRATDIDSMGEPIIDMILFTMAGKITELSKSMGELRKIREIRADILGESKIEDRIKEAQRNLDIAVGEEREKGKVTTEIFLEIGSYGDGQFEIQATLAFGLLWSGRTITISKGIESMESAEEIRKAIIR